MVVRFLSFIFLIVSMLTYGQAYTVSGQVTDKEHTPIAFANVVINTENASIFSGAITSEDGKFFIKDIQGGTYILKISYLGFKTYERAIVVDKNLNLSIIQLAESTEELKGVTVVAKRPTVKRLIDRLVFNVENSTLSNNNVLDVLKYTPGVLVNNEKITVKNGTPIVYMNDRRVYLSDSEIVQLLEGTSANNIKSIEVITNPPAKYDAEGGAVLNIVTKKNIISGYNGSVFGNYKQGSEFPKYSIGTSHFFKTKKLSTYVNFNISPKKDYQNNWEYINFMENDDMVTSWKTDYDRIRKSSNQNINTSIDYDIDTNNSLGFYANMLFAPRDASKTKINTFTEVRNAMGIIDSTFNTVNKSVNEIFNFAFTLDYTHKLKKAGEKISTSLHHTNYDSSSFQNVETGYFYPFTNMAFRDNKFQTYSSQIIKLNTGQVDYELPISGSAQFQAGAKFSNINSESILRQYVFENDIKEDDDENSDTFLYDEMNYALYTSYSKDWNKWSLKLGLRAEYTDIAGNSLSTNQDNYQDYIKFFPSFYILNKLNERNALYLEYNRRIYRPRYEDLNPFKFFMNDYVYVSGDPKLKPQVDDVVTLGYTFNKKHTFELYYRYEKDPTLEIVFQDNDHNLLKYINTNIDKSISYGLDFISFSHITNFWNLNVLASIFYYENQFVALESNNEFTTIDKWSVYAEIGNYFSLLRDNSLTMDVSLLYISPFADGPSIISDRFGFDINLRKSFWNNRASLSVGMIDIFNTKNYNQRTKYLNQDVFLQSRIENRLFTIGFNYKFGNDHLKINQKNVDTEERNRLNNKADKRL